MSLLDARAALNSGDIQKAGDLAEEHLRKDPNDPAGLRMLSSVLFEADRPSTGLAVAEKAARMDSSPDSYCAIAACYASLEMHREALKWINKGLNKTPRHPALLRMMAHTQVGLYDFKEAEKHALKSLEIEEHHQAHVALGFCRLHQRRWGEGWDGIAHGMGKMKWRDMHGYGLPEYSGNGTVLIYGEQGLGDQIAYCSALPNETVQVNCHPKLANLMRRSLGVETHGDQFTETVEWRPVAQSQASMTQAMRFTRRTADDFPKTPYLKPHPEKTKQWAALLKDLPDRPNIGIAWTGGRVGSSGWKSRNLSIDDIQPILDMPFNFISLEYREGEVPEGVIDWPWATRTDDLDDVAALIANLDAIVCVPTTAYHIAGGLGVPAHVIVHETPHFHEGISGACPWWDSVSFYRRPELGTQQAVRKVCESLSELTQGAPLPTTSCSTR